MHYQYYVLLSRASAPNISINECTVLIASVVIYSGPDLFLKLLSTDKGMLFSYLLLKG